jgi:hypothetical protein
MEKDRVAALHHDSSAAKQLTQYSKMQTLHCIHCVSKQLRGGAPPRRNSPSCKKKQFILFRLHIEVIVALAQTEPVGVRMKTAAIALFATALHVSLHQASAWLVQPVASRAQCKRSFRSRSLSTALAARQQEPAEQVKDLLTDQAVATVRAYWHAMRGTLSH